MIGTIKVERVAKTKFRKHDENNREPQFNKQKHHDKSSYRLMKEEEEYVYSPRDKKTNR
jgi:hypothetical protein